MKYICLILGLLYSTFSIAQYNFDDDFESYNIGDYLGDTSPSWTTWSGTTGGNEDVEINDENPNSGANSIYFASSATGGGPQDVVLPFGSLFTEGNFSFQASFFVANGTGAYFNLQAEEEIGETWAVDCFMDNDGTFRLSNGGGAITFLQTTYPFEEWFDVKIEVNITLNIWTLSINNEVIGSFENTENTIASLDIFPLQGNQFYVDDIIVSHTPYDPIGLDAYLTTINTPSNIQFPLNVEVTGTVLNYGEENITSFDVTWTDGTESFTESFSGLNIANLETYDFTHGDLLNITSQTTTNLTVTIENVNGGTDIDETNNSLISQINSYPFLAVRIPLYEHFTSNTCGPCALFNPGFQVLLDANEVNSFNNTGVNAIKFQESYPGAPDQSYNSDVTARSSYYAVTGIPSAHIDGTSTNSSQAEIDDHKDEPCFIDMSGTAVSLEGNDLTVDLSITSYQDYPNTTVHIVLVEDEYNNSQGTNGETEFFQVARKMLPNSSGTTANLTSGNTITISEEGFFAYGNVGAESYNTWNGLANCRVIVYIQNEDDQTVLQSRVIEITGNTTVAESYDCSANGCIDPGTGDGEYSSMQECTASCVTDIKHWNDFELELSPNPTTDIVQIQFKTIEQNVSVTIYSITGQLVYQTNYNTSQGSQSLKVDMRHHERGIYNLSIIQGNKKAEHLIMKQ
jgi:thiol-disulfide isomerase/thioredoxin